MPEFSWVLLDPDGNELRATQGFGSQGDAEDWMGANWRSLLAEGAQSVSLRAGDEEVYTMGLTEA